MSTVRIWVTQLPEPAAVLTPQRLAQLDDRERQHADSFRKVADRARFVIGRLLMRHGLLTQYRLAHPAWRAGPHGKPMLADVRLRIDMNLGHGGNVVVCGFVRNAIIGVDVEPIDRSWDVMEVARAQFAPAETRALSRLDDHTRRETFYRLWTLKEAVVKATGLGLTMPLDSFGVTLDPPRLSAGNATLGDPARWRLAVTHRGIATIAVATRGNTPVDIAFADVPLSVL